MDDLDLLNAYLDRHDQDAFAQLVHRHSSWLYSAARRQLGDGHLAEDVTQAVFLLLSRRAESLRRHTYLSGWLFLTLGYCVREMQRYRSRLARREQEAAAMHPETTDPDPAWNDIAPLLESAVNRLATKDRNAVLLRFYEQKPLAEVGRLLGVSEEAARKRVDRAVDKLRQHLASRGIEAQTLSLSTLILTHAFEPGPADLAGKIITSIARGTGASTPAGIAHAAAKTAATAKLKVLAIALSLPLIGSIWLAAVASGSSSATPAAQPATAPAELPTGTLTLRGIVLDPAGKPVEGARVWLPPLSGIRNTEVPRETHTDAQGRYELGGIPMPPPGTVEGSAIIDKEGYALAWAELMRGNMFTDDLPEVYRLEAPLAITGKVVDEAGNPIANALVTSALQTWPHYTYASLSEGTPYAAKTDAAGRFVVDRLPANCRAHLTVAADGYTVYQSRASYRSDDYPYAPGADDVRVTLHPGGRCTVQLQGFAEHLSSRTLVLATRDTERPEWAVADTKGEAVFRGLSPGTYTISAKGGRWVPAQNVRIEAGGKLMLTLMPAEGAAGQIRPVRGRLLDEASGRPLKQSIYVTRPGARAYGEGECETDQKGEFSLNLPPGEYELSTMGWAEGQYRDERMKISIPADADSAPLLWKVQGRKLVRGTLVDEQGHPLAGTVNLWWPEYVGVDGRFEVGEPNTSNGPQICFAIDAGKRLGATFRYDRERRLDEYRLVLRPLVTVKGSVVDEQGRPVQLEKGDLMVNIGHEGRYASAYRLESNAGMFTISRLPLGLPMRLTVSHAGVTRDFSLGDIKSGEVRDLGQIVLSPTDATGKPSAPRDGKLGGRIVGADGKGIAGIRVQASVPGSYDSAHESITDQDGRFAISRLPAGMDLSLSCYSEISGEARMEKLHAGKTDILWQLKPIAADLIGKPAPPLQVSRWIRGELPELQGLRGQIILLNVGNRFGRRGRGLQDTMSEFDQVAKTYASKGVVAAMIVHPLARQSSDDGLDLVDAAAYVEDAKWNFAVGEDRALNSQIHDAAGYIHEGQTHAAYDCRRPNVTYIIDKHGILRGVALVNDLDGWVRKLLAEP